MYVKCPAANISHVTQKGFGLKPVMVRVDWLWGGGLLPLKGAHTEARRQDALIGYVIGISMPDAEI